MERVLLPLPSGAETSDVTLLQWHVVEGMQLDQYSLFVTVQIGTQMLQYSLRKEGCGLVIKRLAVRVGERVSSDRTLALVGLPEEPLPDGLDMVTIPPLGTSAFLCRRLTFLRILRYTFACAGLLLGLDIWIGAFVTVAGNAAPGILLVLQRALDSYYPTAVACLFMPIMLIVGILLLLLKPPESKNMLEIHHLPTQPDP